jgi:hypothetical protein
MKWTTIHTCKQWQVQTNENGDYRIINPAEDGTRQYYQAESGQYGEPLLHPEPDLAVPCPTACLYKDAHGGEVSPEQNISGLIVKSEDGTVLHRVSLTNAVNKGLAWELDNTGTLTFDGTQYHLQALVVKDAKRIKNYDAYFGTGEVGAVEVLELEDSIPVVD